MGGRYYITGVQLGMLLTYLHEGLTQEVFELLDTIFEKQFMGDTDDFS